MTQNKSLDDLIQNAEATVASKPPTRQQTQSNWMKYAPLILLILLIMALLSMASRLQSLHAGPDQSIIESGRSTILLLMADEVLGFKHLHGYLPTSLPTKLGQELEIDYIILSKEDFELKHSSLDNQYSLKYLSGEFVTSHSPL